MRYSIKYELKYLKKLDRNTQVRVIKAINDLPLGDIKKLQGSYEYYRLRVGNFRIIFSKNDKNLIILIIEIGPRGEIYNKY